MKNKEENRFSLEKKLYQRSIYNRIREMDLQTPIVVDLDLTTYCDLACPECISNPVLNTTFFSSKDVVDLASEIVDIGIKGVVLIGGGEPLMHNQASKVINILGKAKVEIGLVTNGTQINKHLDAISEYVSWTRVSVDAGTPETYEVFRPSKKGGSVFSKVISNMNLLARSKKGDLGFSFLMMSRDTGESNFNEIKIAGELAKEIGCDYFELKSMFDHNHIIVKQDKDVIFRAKKQLSALKEIQNDTFKIYDAFTYKELIEKDEEGTIQIKDYTTCPSSKLRKTITPHGIYPCAYHRNNKRMIVNSIENKTLEEALKHNIFEINPSIDCNFECARHELNLEYSRIVKNKVELATYDDYDIFI